MKKISFLLYIIGIILIFGSCKKDLILFSSSENLVGFSSTSIKINEGGSGTVSLYLGATSNKSTTVTLVTSTEGCTIPAESSDYSLSTTSIQMDTIGKYTFTINTVDNSVYTGSKTFYIKISSTTSGYQTAAQDSILVTIVDDEHPLKNWIGTFTVDAVSYGSPGDWDETWTVTTATDASDDNILWFTGICKGDVAVKGTFDKDAGTITFEPALNVSTINGGYGYVVDIYPANDDMVSDAGTYVTQAILTACSTSKIVGTISDDGSIHIDKLAPVLRAYVYCWDVFDTYWTLNTSTKSAVISSSKVPIDKFKNPRKNN